MGMSVTSGSRFVLVLVPIADRAGRRGSGGHAEAGQNPLHDNEVYDDQCDDFQAGTFRSAVKSSLSIDM